MTEVIYNKEKNFPIIIKTNYKKIGSFTIQAAIELRNKLDQAIEESKKLREIKDKSPNKETTLISDVVENFEDFSIRDYAFFLEGPNLFLGWQGWLFFGEGRPGCLLIDLSFDRRQRGLRSLLFRESLGSPCVPGALRFYFPVSQDLSFFCKSSYGSFSDLACWYSGGRYCVI